MGKITLKTETRPQLTHWNNIVELEESLDEDGANYVRLQEDGKQCIRVHYETEINTYVVEE